MELLRAGDQQALGALAAVQPQATRFLLGRLWDPDETIRRRAARAIGVAAASHREIGAAALAAGLHVMMEKPIGLSLAEGEELVALQREGQVFALMLNQRTDPLFLAMREVIGKLMNGVTSNKLPTRMKRNSDSSTMKVVKDVIMVRDSVWFSEILMISIGEPLRILRKFSRIRSNTTMVSFREYPRIVRIAATVGRAISTRKSARKPSVMIMSWNVAMIAARPNRISKRI